jgi:cytochrome P450
VHLTFFLSVNTTRLVLRPFTFSNGMTIPTGTLISLPTKATHTDEIVYENPNEFDGFRFAKLREREGDVVTSRHQLISASANNLPWGLGRHSW